MTLRRILTVIIVLLIIVGLLLGVSWYMSRRNAQNNGETPISFREFLGIGSPSIPGAPTEGELSGEFTPEPGRTVKYDANNNGINDWREDLNGNGIIDGNEDLNNNGINDGDEDFDGNGIPNWEDEYSDPEIPDNTPNTPGGDGGFTPGGPTDPGENPGGTTVLPPYIPTDPGPGGVNPYNPNDPDYEGFPDDGFDYTDFTNSDTLSCTFADTHINFTADEIEKLAKLQERFNAISGSLYDKAALSQQTSFYDSLAIRHSQIVESLNFCENRAPSLGSTLNRRVATPFYNASGSVDTFTNHPIVTSDANDAARGYKPILEKAPITIVTLIEQLLKISIW